MKILKFPFFILFLLSLGNVSESKQDLTQLKLSVNCLGVICVGMTVKQASTGSLGELQVVQDHKLVKYNAEMIKEKNHCFYVSSNKRNSMNEVQFMVTNGHISRIDILDGRIKSLSGVGIGDSERKVKDIYKTKIRVEPHHYNPKGHYLIYEPKDKLDQKYNMLFETDGKKVTNFRSGYTNEVGWIEGCL